MNQLSVHLERVRRRWVLVAVITFVAVVAALVGVLIRPDSWTGRAALAIVSQNRSPDQDAVLGRGYVDLFNQLSQQRVMAGRLGLAPDVRFNATLAAGSPIVYVEATAPDPARAARAATLLATTYRDDVRNNLTGDRVAAAAELTTQLQASQARLAALPPGSPDRPTLADQITSLRSQLVTVQSNTTNQLKDLQLDAGVTEDSSGAVRILVLALVGGLAGGVALALALGLVETRLTTPTETRTRLGREVLAEVVDGPDPDGMRALTDVLALPDLPVPGAVAVVATDAGGARAGSVATGLARLRARQHGNALLVRAAPGTDDPPGALGVWDFLDQDAPRTMELGALITDDAGLRVVPPGRLREDVDAVCSRDGAAELVRRARALADLVVLAAPSASTSATGPVLCAAADRTVLVVEEGVTRTSDARRALDRAERAGARVLGIVLVRGTGRATPPTGEETPARDVGVHRSDDTGPLSVPSARPPHVPHGVGG
ncbi:MAG: hypothetical protein QOE59_865 [Actinomycetota bacterium]|jgi:capsular polysaccharide biosynthesis protein|nr:hypothetical protein [Actinomycetota bacterium]